MELSWGEPLQSVPIVNRRLKSVNLVLKVLQSWLSSEENVLPFAKNQSLVPSTCIMQLTITCDSSIRRPRDLLTC